jgi:uncharacterized membrane protein
MHYGIVIVDEEAQKSNAFNRSRLLVRLILIMLVLPVMLATIPAVSGHTYNVNAGASVPESQKACITCTYGDCGPSADLLGSMSGAAGAWASPSSIDFGDVALGSCTFGGYTISVPADTPSGNYTLDWTISCQGGQMDDGTPCSTFTFVDSVVVNSGSATSTTPSSPECSSVSHLSNPSPNIQICVPNGGLQIASTGSASEADADGDAVPLSNLSLGSLVTLNSASVSIQGAGVQNNVQATGKVTLEQWVAEQNGGTLYYIPSKPTSSPEETAIDEYVKEFTLDKALIALGAAAGCTVACPVVITSYTIFALSSAIITYSNAIGNENENGVGNKQLNCDMVYQVMICDFGTNYTISASNGNTTVRVISGNVLVQNLATGKLTEVLAGYSDYIPGNQTQASQQNPQQNATTTNQSSVSLPIQNTTSSNQTTQVTTPQPPPNQTTAINTTAQASQPPPPLSHVIGGGIIFLLLVAAFFYIIYRIYKFAKSRSATATKKNAQNSEESTKEKGENDSMKTLKMRYAKGQITKAQYERMKEDLES